MLRKEAGQKAASGWYLVARKGDLIARTKSGLRVGEDEYGELLLGASGAQALIEFTIDKEQQLKVSVLPELLELSLPDNVRAPSAYIDGVKGARIHLPNNTVTIGIDFVAADRHPDAIDIDVVQIPVVAVPAGEVTQRPAATMPETQHSDAGQANLADRIPTLEIEVPRRKVPELDTPVDGVRETLITELPYAGDQAEKPLIPTAVVQPQTRNPVGAGHARTNDQPQPHGSSKRMPRWFITSVAAGLLAAVFSAFVFQTFMVSDRASIGEVAETPAAQRRQATTPPPILRGDSTPVPPSQADTAPIDFAEQSLNTLQLPAPAKTPAVPPQPTPELDRNLAKALKLYEAGYITAPAGGNSVAALRLVLDRDPGNPAARALLRRCADRLVESAKLADEFDLNYEARNLIEEVMAFYPDHQEANALWARWTRRGTG